MLKHRILSAAVGILYIILMINIGGWFFKISVLLMTFILMHEFYHAFINKGYKPVIWLGYIFIFLLFSLLFFPNIIVSGYNILILIAIITITGLIMPIFSQKLKINDILVTVFAALYPGVLVFFLVPLAFDSIPYGMNLLILTFLITWSTDTFAYFFGSRFGKNKLCPSISPNKTIEGGLGGLFGSIVVGILFGMILRQSIKLSIDTFHFAIIGLLGGVFSQLGDLCASSIKRYCGVKDFGKLLPGHGGLLDRFDSLLFTLPTVYLYYLIFLAK